MTCRHALNLLEDYVDNELSTETTSSIDKHLTVCPRCRKAYADASTLKETLQSIHITPPDSEYQNRAVDLIVARATGGAATNSDSDDSTPVSPIEKIGLMRAVASFAVAASVLLSAMMIDSELPIGETSYSLSASDKTTNGEFKKALTSGENSPFTKAEWNRLTGAMLMMGSPGPLGKSVILADLSIRNR